MINFLINNRSLKTVLLLLCGIPFLFLPFYHFHPDNTHGHHGELTSHKHTGHFHSHEVENLAHFIDLHPMDEGLDKRRHHSHSSPEHDSDGVQFNVYKTHLPKIKQTLNLNHYDLPAPLVNPEPDVTSARSIQVLPLLLPGLSIFPPERSPPAVFLI